MKRLLGWRLNDTTKYLPLCLGPPPADTPQARWTPIYREQP